MSNDEAVEVEEQKDKNNASAIEEQIMEGYRTQPGTIDSDGFEEPMSVKELKRPVPAMPVLPGKGQIKRFGRNVKATKKLGDGYKSTGKPRSKKAKVLSSHSNPNRTPKGKLLPRSRRKTGVK